MNFTAELVVDAQCSLGEGPIWDAEHRIVYWIDFDQGTMHSYCTINQLHHVTKLPVKVASFALREAGGAIIAGVQGLAYYDIQNGHMKMICDPESDFPHTRFNDGKCDPKGRFLAGTASDDNEPKGAFYILHPDGSLKKLLDGIACSNGITWSKDERTMYYIDSLAYRVDAFDYDMDLGEISNKRTVIRFPGTEVLPDGMTSDEEGMLWIAEWGGWKVGRWNPQTGERLAVVEVPAKYVTSCVFAGDNMDELYITTARSSLTSDSLQSQPYAGGLFRAKVQVKGRATYLFKG